MENTNAPQDETIKSPEVVADQATPADDSPAPAAGQAVTLSGLAGAHVDAHPGFDPAMHAADASGKPITKADGSYAKKRGRKAGGSPLPRPAGKENAPDPAEVRAAAAAASAAAARINIDEAARQSANLVINSAVWICGEQIGKPIDKPEADGLKMSFVNYYESRGVPNIPPELGLLVALFSYIAPRLRQAEEKEGKVTKMVNWFKLKIHEISGR